MSHLTLTILSNNPPGGRCTLYAQYAKELSHAFDLKIKIICPDEDHIHRAPGLLIADRPVRPADGIMIDPDDISLVLKQAGLQSDKMADIHQRLEQLLENTLNILSIPEPIN